MAEAPPEGPPGGPRVVLADFLSSRASELLSIWEGRARLSSGARFAGLVLKEQLPGLLHKLAQHVRAHGEGTGPLLEALPGGFDLRRVTSELSLLRDVLIEQWSAIAGSTPGFDDLRLLHGALDAAITEVVERSSRSRERTLVSLDRLSAAALGGSELESLLPRLLSVMVEAIGRADGASLLLLEAGRVRARATVGLGGPGLESGLSLEPGGGLTGRVVRSRRAAQCRDGSADPCLRGDPLRADRLRAVHAMPLVSGDEVIGVVALGSVAAEELPADDVELLQTLSRRASSIVVQALLADRERAAVRRSQETEERFRLLVEGVKDYAIFMLDTEGRIMSWNAGAQRIKGYTAEEAIGRSFEMFYPASAVAEGSPKAHLRRAAREGRAIFEGPRVRKDGTSFFAEVLITALRDPEGRLRGFAKLTRDITARREREAEQRRALDALEHGDPFFMVDRDWQVVMVNRSFEQMTRISRDQSVGRVLWDVFPEARQSSSRSWNEYHRCMLERVPVQFEEYHAPLELWTGAAGYPLTDGGIAVFFRDVSRLKKTEDALRQSEQRMRAILDTAVDGIITIDERGTIQSLNPATTRIFGFTPQEMIGRNVKMLMPEPDHGRHDGYLRRYLETGERRIIGIGREVKGRRKDGTVFPMELAVSETMLPKGRLFTGMVRDISVRKHAEHDREEALALLDTVISTAPVALAFVDEGLSFVRINDAHAKIIGRSIVDTLGHSIEEAMPNIEPPVAAAARTVFATGEPVINEELSGPVSGAPGQRAHWLLSCYPVKNAAGQTYLVGLAFVDVTELKRVESELRQRTEFEEQLVGMVSHDLRNPLHAILMSAQMLLQREDLDPRAVKALARVQSSAQRATRLIRDLLDFTKARLGGGIPAQRSPLEVHSFVRSVVDEVRLVFPDRRIEVRRGGDGNGEWDPDRLAQVVTNLVTNAVKYSPDDSVVTVRTVGEDEHLTLEVHNGGSPIAQEQLARLFQPMRRGTQQSEGLGLGLFIVDQIVRAHQGKVEVESSAEAGTTFRAVLPRHARQGG